MFLFEVFKALIDKITFNRNNISPLLADLKYIFFPTGKKKNERSLIFIECLMELIKHSYIPLFPKFPERFIFFAIKLMSMLHYCPIHYFFFLFAEKFLLAVVR